MLPTGRTKHTCYLWLQQAGDVALPPAESSVAAGGETDRSDETAGGIAPSCHRLRLSRLWEQASVEEVGMTKIRVDGVVDELKPQVLRALQEAVANIMPEASFDENQLFAEFRSAIVRRCATWESIPNEYLSRNEGW